MAEGRTTRVKTCGQCGNGYEWRYGEALYRGCCSQECARERAAFRQATFKQRHRQPLRCIGCGTEVPKRHKRCEPCNKSHYQAYYAGRWAAAPKWDRQERRCDGCGAAYVPHVPTQRYCSNPCRAKADSRKPQEARPLYKSARWRKIREEQLAQTPTCQFCLSAKATVCDHVVPHRGSVQSFWSGPFQSLCARCHNSDKQRLERLAA